MFRENFVSENGYPFDVEAHLQGFTVASAKKVIQEQVCDNVIIELKLAFSVLGCAEGYTESEVGQCVTPYGCIYPQLQEAYLSGNAQLGWREPARCVDECTLGMSSAAAQCARVDES